jgi:hypothetical protein
MGAACSCKKATALNRGEAQHPGGTLGVMFGRIDKDGKGYIDLRDLNALMKDDYKAYFHGRGAEHIMEKYGQEGQMSFENFQHWWNSTYTSYNDDAALAGTIDEVLRLEQQQQQQPPEDAEESEPRPLQGRNVPSNKNLAVSRS